MRRSFLLINTWASSIVYHARIAKQWHIPDLSTDIPVDRSLLPGNGVYGVSALVPAAMNDELLLLFIEFYLIDALPPLRPKMSLWMSIAIVLFYVKCQKPYIPTDYVGIGILFHS